ncbi:hypothetical protein GOP47_0010433 [Adiantum capillus-veneris]|uniref:Uncharacterized protein n=1 Tax=Adiantum capillus-veneris TaxID=13818 RepID=A0A9D4UVZ4_ADICA|nr:hypothetical protein GOP47_0010433 [Adiantum capillus-veneris]
MDESGYTIFGPLQQAGIYHCTCGRADHCDEGMKLGVYVRLLPGHPSEAAPTPPDLDYPTPPPIDNPDLDYPTPPPIDTPDLNYPTPPPIDYS